MYLGCLLPDDCPALRAVHQRLLLLQRNCLLCICRLCCRRRLLLLETLRQQNTSLSLGSPKSAGVADSRLTAGSSCRHAFLMEPLHLMCFPYTHRVSLMLEIISSL